MVFAPRADVLTLSIDSSEKRTPAMKSHSTSVFYAIHDFPKFFGGMQSIIDSLAVRQGIYTGDNIFTYNRNLSFLDDTKLMDAHTKHATTDAERAILWRLAVIIWGIRNGLKREGDFVDCACGSGFIARVACDAINFADISDRRFFLFDSFESGANLPDQAKPEMAKKLFAEVKARFADTPRVSVTLGLSPDILKAALPGKIAFLHLRVETAEAEIDVLNALFDRVVPGALIVLDNYGWLSARAHRLSEETWFAKQGYHVIELPTGQGLVIK